MFSNSLMRRPLCLLPLVIALCTAPGAGAFSIDSSVNLSNGTILQALQARSGGAEAPQFDQNWKDYDIILALIAHAGFGPTLSASSGNGQTFFTASDSGMRQTARDLLEVHGLPAPELETERTVFDALVSLLATRYAQPGAALTIFLRYHVVPARLTLTDVVGSGSFNTLAAQPIGRSGVTLEPMEPNAPWPQLTIFPPSLHAHNGNVHNLDRLLLPDMSAFALAEGGGAAAPTKTPAPSRATGTTVPPLSKTTTSVSSSEGSGGQTAPTSQSAPQKSPSAVPSPQPSVTPVPSVATAVVPIASASPFVSPTPSKTPPPSPVSVAGKGGDADGDGQCFPGSATVQTRRGRVPLSGVRVGADVMTPRGWERVIAYSHAMRYGEFGFIELGVAAGNASCGAAARSVTVRATHGHMLPIGRDGLLMPIAKARTGQTVRTADARLARIVYVRDVRGHGLFAPHTPGGDLFVDGVLASCYTTAVRPATAHAWLAPVRALVRSGVDDPLSGALNRGGGSLLLLWARVTNVFKWVTLSL